MAQLQNTISGQINNQLPEYIRSGFPNWNALLSSYFKFMEDSTQNGTVYQLRNLLANRMVDTTQDQFLQYFQADFLPYFPQSTALDTKKLLKAATQFYQTKGSQDSIEFLFRVLYDLEAEVYLPKNQVLKLSDGRWTLPQSIKLSLSAQNQSFNVALLLARQGIGSESNTTCVIENVNVAVDPTLNREIVELFLSSISASFIPGESIIISCGNDQFGNPIVFEEKIIGSISGIIIDPHNQGLKYKGTTFYANGSINYPGDPVSIIGGLADSNDIIQAVAYVGNVTQGSLQSITVEDGGYGYQLDPNTIVTFVDAPGDTGSGASAIVNGVDSANAAFLFVNTDSIRFKQNVTIGNTTYQFSNSVNANVNTVIANALSFFNLAISPLTSMNLTFGGAGYTETPSISLRSVFDTDLSAGLHAAYIASPTQANYDAWRNSQGNVEDLGEIAAVRVLAGGSGYSNTKDTIYVDSVIGYGATFGFITDVSGSIQQVLVTNPGFGYGNLPPKPPVFLANTANAQNSASGTGAILQAFGYNDGEQLTLSVSDIGRILDIRMVDRGFDYLSTPLVSLRNEDVTIAPISTSLFYVQGEQVWQGANANSASFTAFVDEYDRANNVLRLYNYVGSLNVAANVTSANINAIPSFVKVYGNGKAKANAQFFGGLIEYPGFWLGTFGFLSADQNFQGATKFHNYSYLVKVEKSLADFEQTIQKIVHPAGMKMLALTTETDQINRMLLSEMEKVQTQNTANSSGTANISPFGNGTVTGTGTSWNVTAHVGDLFTFNQAAFPQSKVIKQVISANTLVLESNTLYFAPDELDVTHGSNVVITTGSVANLAVGDIIKTSINGNAQTSIVQLVTLGGNTVNVNTVFNTNTVNVEYMVFPAINGASYIIQTPA